MKFLIIQENGRHEANRNFRECFCAQRALRKLGHTCDITGLNHSYPITDPNTGEKLGDLNPNAYDFVINLENYDNGWVPDLSEYNKPYKILWSIDAHCKGIKSYLNEYNKGNYQLVLQATPDYLNDIPNSEWFPNCFDDTLIKKLDVPKEYGVGFCGNYVTMARRDFIDELHEDFGLKRDIFVIGNEMVKAVNSYKIHFNMNMANDLNYRNFETIGCGTVLLTNYNPNYESLGFIHGETCLIYRDYDDCSKILCDIPEKELLTIAQNGYILSRKHTYEARMRDLCHILKIPYVLPKCD